MMLFNLRINKIIAACGEHCRSDAEWCLYGCVADVMCCSLSDTGMAD